MCFDLDRRPPIPPLAGAAVEHRDLEPTSGYGSRYAAFVALVSRASSPMRLPMPGDMCSRSCGSRSQAADDTPGSSKSGVNVERCAMPAIGSSGSCPAPP